MLATFSASCSVDRGSPGSEAVPTPGGSVGDVWINPASLSVAKGATVTIEIHANTGSSALAAFAFTVLYSKNLFTYISIAEVVTGLNLTNNTNTDGIIITTGFNANGITGSSDLALIRITLTASSTVSGTGDITLSIQNLIDITYAVIGTPNAVGSSVIVN
jgi:hypothetical protein